MITNVSKNNENSELTNPVSLAVTNEIKKSLNGFNEQKMYDNMLKHYQTLHLIDEKGNWAMP